jgi:Na+-transporting NADH:ubiquinone oxidoreductase subunit C
MSRYNNAKYLQTQTDFDHNFGIDPSKKGLSIGKMFGVLVVQNQQNEIGYITSVSGKLAEKNIHKKFVPPVYDMLTKDSHFLEEEKVLNNINLALEIRKGLDDQRFPLYIADVDNSKYYIIPLRGNGLWNAIWGYIALKQDINTIEGISFGHEAETAGLGAEITEDWFMNSFNDEKILNSNGEFVGIYVSKSNNDPDNIDKNDNEVDAISGATITGDGVSDMIKERLENYLPYFNNLSNE